MRGLDADELLYLDDFGTALPYRDPHWCAVAHRLVERGLLVVMRVDRSTHFVDRTPAALQLLALHKAGEV